MIGEYKPVDNQSAQRYRGTNHYYHMTNATQGNSHKQTNATINKVAALLHEAPKAWLVKHVKLLTLPRLLISGETLL